MLSVKASQITKGVMVGNAHQHWVIPFLKERNGPAYERCRSICLDGTNPLPNGVPHGHTQYSVGRTSERRALVDWIKLSITDTESEGTIPTPDLNAFTWWILTGANFPAASHLIESGGSDVVPHTQILDTFRLLHRPPFVFLILPHLLPLGMT